MRIILIDKERWKIGIDGNMIEGNRIESEEREKLRDKGRKIGDEKKIEDDENGEEEKEDKEIEENKEMRKEVDKMKRRKIEIIEVGENKESSRNIERK